MSSVEKEFGGSTDISDRLIIEGGSEQDKAMIAALAVRLGMGVSRLVEVEHTAFGTDNNGSRTQEDRYDHSNLALLQFSKEEAPDMPEPELWMTTSRGEFLEWYADRVNRSEPARSQRAQLGAATRYWNFLAKAIRSGFSARTQNPPQLPEFQQVVYEKNPGVRMSPAVSDEGGKNVIDIKRSTALDVAGFARYIVTAAIKLEELNKIGSLNTPSLRERTKEYVPYGLSVRGLLVFADFCQYKYDQAPVEADDALAFQLADLFVDKLNDAKTRLRTLH